MFPQYLTGTHGVERKVSAFLWSVPPQAVRSWASGRLVSSLISMGTVAVPQPLVGSMCYGVGVGERKEELYCWRCPVSGSALWRRAEEDMD